MRFSLLTSIAAFWLALASTQVAASGLFEDLPEPVTYANLTTRTTGTTYTTDQCTNVAGSYNFYGYKINYNFGCVCLSDVDQYCLANGLNSAVNQWIKGQFGSCNSFKYPAGSQPTCDNKGGYTCPQGTKQADGSCTAVAASCGCGYTAQKDGSCCPRGTTKINGQCCGTTCSGTSNGQCTGQASCPSGTSASGPNGLCCASGQTGYKQVCCASSTQMEDPNNLGTCICSDTSKALVNGACVSKCSSSQSWNAAISKCCRADMTATTSTGQCACPTGFKDNGSSCARICRSDQILSSSGSCVCNPGFKDNGSACVSACRSDQTFTGGSCQCKAGYIDNGSACILQCAAGYTFVASKSCQNGAGLCCKQGATPCKTICCPAGQDEVATGVCCAIGSTYSGGKCVTPSGAAKSRRSLAPILDPKSDAALCPGGLSACPIPGAAAGQYECVDSTNDLQSCGGCASLGTGRDCTTIPGARFMGCEAGRCAVYSCKRGWKAVNGTSCVRA